MELYTELDADGNIVKECFTLSPYSSLPEGHTWVPYVDSLAALKLGKKSSIESWRDAACIAPVTIAVNGVDHLWAADSRTQLLLGTSVSMATLGVVDAPPVWRSVENINVPVTLDDLKTIAAALVEQTQTAYAHSWLLKYQVDQATTASQLDSIVW